MAIVKVEVIPTPNFLNIDKTTGIGLWTLGCIIIILAIICIFRFK